MAARQSALCLGLLLVVALFERSSGSGRAYVRPPKGRLVDLHHRRSANPSEPEQVHISLKGPNHVSVTWVTPSKDSAESLVLYGAAAGNYTMKAQGSSESYKYLAYRSGDVHHVAIGPLEPGQTYFYRVGDPDVSLSKEFSFRMVPRPGADVAVNFAVIGDLGQTVYSQSTIKNVGEEDADAIILCGDLAYAERYQPRWDTWGRMMEPVIAQVPFMATEGNHEIEDLKLLAKPFLAYNTRFPMPHEESGSKSNLYYSFEVGVVHVLMLGSYTDFGPGSAQYEWLEADLAKVDRQRTPWLLAVYHAPWYNSNYAHQGQGDAMKAAVEDLLYAARVDFVITGHVHAYERTARVYKDKENHCGPVYIVVGDGGNYEGLATRYMDPQPAWSMKREATYGYGMLSFNSTHGKWQWHRNEDDYIVHADELVFQSLARPGSGCEAFVDSEAADSRGSVAAVS